MSFHHTSSTAKPPNRSSSSPRSSVLGSNSTAELHDDLGKSVDISKNDDMMNEQSPLLPPVLHDEDGDLHNLSPMLSPKRGRVEWNEDTGVGGKTKSSWYLFLLTVSCIGLQIAWSVELSNGSPYLLSLGITKSFLAFVWIAGPLSGTLVQPYVGIKSDKCRSRFGKRRPFMVGGALATIASLLILAWTREIVGGILSIFGVPQDSKGTQSTTIVLAVLMVYILDFAINVIQAGTRAFIVDNAPTHQQASANAWASRLLGIGNIIGYLFGYADLPKYMWFFGNTQFKVLSVIASLTMATTLAVSCLSVSERDPRLEGEPSDKGEGVVAFFRSLWLSVRHLPPQIKRVCIVQLAAWIGWFPFLFYITTYIGQLYVDPIFRENPNMTEEEIDEAWQQGTRVGTFALLAYAVVTLSGSIMLPWLINSSNHKVRPSVGTPMTVSPSTARLARATDSPLSTDRPSPGDNYFDVQTNGRQADAANTVDAYAFKRTTTSRALSRDCSVDNLQVHWLTLKRAWLLSHVLFAVLMCLTFFVHTSTLGSILVGIVGIPWAMTGWAPYALIAAEVSKRDNIRRGIIRPPPTRDGEMLARGESDSEGSDQAGTVLGIHNVAIAAPQVIATLLSAAIFKALQKPRGVSGDDSVAWVLRCGGIAALVAAWLTRRISEEGDEEDVAPKW